MQRWLGEPMFLRCSGSPADGSVEAINTVNFGMALDLLCLPVSRSPSGRLDLHPQIVIKEDAVPFKLFGAMLFTSRGGDCVQARTCLSANSREERLA